MQREHEEAMRADFAQYTRLARNTDPAELDAAATEQKDIVQRWTTGPHRRHWRELEEIDHQYQVYPLDMLRERDLRRHNNPTYPDSTVDRSWEQATDLAFQRTPGLRKISAGYISHNGEVQYDGTLEQREYPESRRNRGPIERGR
ncbi:hypothetical protein ACFWFQ_08300 [Nocardia salmonicida]|uniref:hypothetical protein n=1 Tax=Nocardia salmonicida TaxID=53431 RepID=UPI00364A770C